MIQASFERKLFLLSTSNLSADGRTPRLKNKERCIMFLTSSEQKLNKLLFQYACELGVFYFFFDNLTNLIVLERSLSYISMKSFGGASFLLLYR